MEKLDKYSHEKCLEKAGGILSKRLHSICEIRRKLASKEFPCAIIEKVIAELEARKFVDDAKFAEIFASELREKGCGEMKIRLELKKRGIDSALAVRIMKDKNISDPETEMNCAIKALKKKSPAFLREIDHKKRREKIYNYLGSKGFRFETIDKAVRESGLCPGLC